MRPIPLSVITTWPAPNYKNPETRGNSIFIVTIILTVLAFLATCLRLWTRHFLKRKLGLDDLFCGIALIFSIAYAVAILLAEDRYGANRHFWDAPLDLIPPNFKIAMVSKVLFVCATGSVRQSLICFYGRMVVSAQMKRFQWVLRFATFINVSVVIAFVPLSIFECSPVSAYWVLIIGDTNPYCLSDSVVTFTSSCIIAICDFLTVILPVPIILRLRMSWPRRIGVITLLNLGLLASAAGALRVYFIWEALVASYDQSWYVYPLWLAGAVELNMAIICCSAAPIRPFFTKYAPGFKESFRKLGTRIRTFCSSVRDTLISAFQNSSAGHSSHDAFLGERERSVGSGGTSDRVFAEHKEAIHDPRESSGYPKDPKLATPAGMEAAHLYAQNPERGVTPGGGVNQNRGKTFGQTKPAKEPNRKFGPDKTYFTFASGLDSTAQAESEAADFDDREFAVAAQEPSVVSSELHDPRSRERSQERQQPRSFSQGSWMRRQEQRLQESQRHVPAADETHLAPASTSDARTEPISQRFVGNVSAPPSSRSTGARDQRPRAPKGTFYSENSSVDEYD